MHLDYLQYYKCQWVFHQLLDDFCCSWLAVSRIALVKPDKARGVEDVILRSAQMGQITEKVCSGASHCILHNRCIGQVFFAAIYMPYLRLPSGWILSAWNYFRHCNGSNMCFKMSASYSLLILPTAFLIFCMSFYLRCQRKDSSSYLSKSTNRRRGKQKLWYVNFWVLFCHQIFLIQCLVSLTKE